VLGRASDDGGEVAAGNVLLSDPISQLLEVEHIHALADLLHGESSLRLGAAEEDPPSEGAGHHAADQQEPVEVQHHFHPLDCAM
jgi:hypothetical protein